LALAVNGNLWAWGLNNQGQLGDGTTSDRNAPVIVMNDVKNITAGSNHTFAIDENDI
jgi:alpha-tubulin suppressor-like RCC1 family protein